jgi:hypothetical protein
MDRQQWEFEYDLDAGADSDILGRLIVRRRFIRGARWRMPIVEYLDRAFVVPGRYPDGYKSLEVIQEPEEVDGHPCQVIHGIWLGRDFTFWLDPEYDYLPRRYTMRMDHASVGFQGPEAVPVRGGRRIFVPPQMEDLLSRPVVSEETLSEVTLKEEEGRKYIAGATLDKTVTFEGNISYSEHVIMQATSFSLLALPEASAFLAFDGLLRDGTPVEERVDGRRSTRDIVNHYVIRQGVFVAEDVKLKPYFPQLWDDLRKLVTDFSLENLRRVDSTFLVVVCAILAISTNGALAYAACRRK